MLNFGKNKVILCINHLFRRKKYSLWKIRITGIAVKTTKSTVISFLKRQYM